MRIGIIAFGLVGCLLIAVFLYCWSRLRSHLYIHIPADTIDLPGDWEAETNYVENSDGQKIAYWYFPVENAKAIVILIHGYHNPGGKAQMLAHASYLRDAGYTTVHPDLRSFGESDGSKITFGVHEWKDIEAVYDSIRSRPESADKKIGYLGISFGATVAIVTAGQTEKGDFIIASVPYMSFRTLFQAQILAAGLPPMIFYPFMHAAADIELGSDRENFAPMAHMAAIKVPILLISAKQDEVLRSQDAVELYHIARGPKELWQADATHDVRHLLPEEFETRVLSFLENTVIVQ